MSKIKTEAAVTEIIVTALTEILSPEDLSAVEALDLEVLGVPSDSELPDLSDVLKTELAADDEMPEAPVLDTRTLEEVVKDVTADQANDKIAEINAAFGSRQAFETLHNAANDSIQDKLKTENKRMALPGIAGLMVATHIDANIINREINAGKRFNIYAIGKLTDILHGLNSGHFKNAINIAVMKSMFKFRAAGLKFDGIAVLGAASDKVKVDKAIAAVLVRHTVSASTAPTQSSSTMNALATIGAVVNRGSVKFPIWELTNAPVTKKLEALMKAAA